MNFPFAVNPLPRVKCSTFAEIDKEVRPLRRPTIIDGLLSDWPALTKWSPEFLAECLREKTLEVDVSPDRFFPGETRGTPDGRTKSVDGRRTVQMRGMEFFEKLSSQEDRSYYLHSIPLPGELNCDVGSSRDSVLFGRNLWISSKGHVTPTHFDGGDNVLAQLLGEKKFLLFSPDHFDDLYLHSCDHRYARHSQVFDFENANLEDYPRLRNLVCHSAHLKPGDALYIPNFWLHCAYTLSFSASMNVWWNDSPFQSYASLMTDWIDLRDKLFSSFPSDMPDRFKAYFLKGLLFGDFKRFTEEQIIGVLREHEAGAKMIDLARSHGIPEATIHYWKAKFGGRGG